MKTPFAVAAAGKRSQRFVGILLLAFLGLGAAWHLVLSPMASASEAAGKPAEKIWLAYRGFLRAGAWEQSRAELENLYQWKLNQGIRNHYAFAGALVEASERLMREGHPSAVPMLLVYAEKMAPDFSAHAWARARWLWSQRPFSASHAGRALWEEMRGLYLSLLAPLEGIRRGANFLLWLLFGFLIAVAAFAVSLLLRYFSYFLHHLRHRLRVPGGRTGTLLGLLILFSPLLAGGGWMWLFVFWLLVFWIYAGRAERAVTVGIFLLFLLLPSGVRVYASLVSALTDGGTAEIVEANTGAWTPELYRHLRALETSRPGDGDLLQALALVEKRMGQWAEAEAHLRRWAQEDPGNPGAFNNLGNVLLASRRLPEAAAAYEKAIQMDPGRTEPYYNLGQVYLLNLKLNEAEAEFSRARERHAELISHQTRIATRHPNRVSIDRTIDLFGVWKRAFTAPSEREEIARGFWALLWRGAPLAYGEVLAAVLLGILGLLALVAPRLASIRVCEKCGEFICSRCTRSLVIGNQCSSCVRAFTKGGSADPQAARKRRAEVARHQEKLSLLPRRLALFLPGAGHLLRGRSREGMIYLWLFILFLLKVLWWRGWVPDPRVPEVSLEAHGMIFTGVLFTAFYGFVQYRTARLRARRKSHFQRD